MKILLEKYPKGTFKGQQTDGRYIDGYLYQNLQDCAKVIVDDMTFMAVVFSSTLEVGTGKSVLVSQCGEAWTEIMKKMHGIDVPFTENNCVLRPKDLIERAFEVPRYSFLWLDEWEDSSYWSELGMSLRRFFRKCRQLNLFIMVIIPNWFQLPLSYAVSRSVFAIDVRFERGFQRGFFSFYGFNAKRKLYIEGKRTHNYHVARPDFVGRFLDGYGIPEAAYRKLKLLDAMKDAEGEERIRRPEEIEKDVSRKLFRQIHEKLKIPVNKLAEGFEISDRTGFAWIKAEKDKEKATVESETAGLNDYNSNLNEKETVWDEAALKVEPST